MLSFPLSVGHRQSSGNMVNHQQTKCGFVTVVGLPNAGKSTFVNAAVGSKVSIVSRKPQTTRGPLRGIALCGDTQLIFVDTPGLHPSVSRTALSSLSDVDVIVFMIDAEDWLEQDAWILEQITLASRPVILAINKVDKIKEKIETRTAPVIINYNMNAGFIPKEHWVQTYEGAGRNIGEACHIYDLFNYLTGSKHTSVNAASINVGGGKYLKTDNFNASFTYEDGSVCNLIYTALGNKAFPKEEMTVYCDGSIMRLSDYKTLEIFGTKTKSDSRSVVDKGQFSLLELLAKYLTGKSTTPPISFDEQYRATDMSFEVENLIK